MGSFPYPPNGIVEIDYEFIHIFKKPGKGKRVSKEIKEVSKLTKEEWKEYFSGHWHFGGAKQIGHEAMFPDELPRRLIKMFTYKDVYLHRRYCIRSIFRFRNYCEGCLRASKKRYRL